MSPVLVGRSRLHDEREGLGGSGGQVLKDIKARFKGGKGLSSSFYWTL